MDGSATFAGITIRAVCAADKARIAEAFQALEPRTIYQRFLFPKKELSDEELRQLSQPDAASDVVLVAVTGAGDEERIVGLGRYTRRAASAEIAFTVQEDYQGRGIASRLLQKLADLARRNGIAQFEADLLAENAPMLSVLRHSGLPIAESEKDGVVHATLTLGDAVGAPRSGRRRVPAHALPGWLWALPLAFLSVWILHRFIEPLAWAGIVGIVTWPLYRRFARRIGRTTSSSLAALPFTVLIAAFAFAPMAFAFGALFAEVAKLVAWIHELDQTGLALPRWLESLPLVGSAVSEPWHAALGAPGGISGWLQRADSSAVLGWAQTLGGFMERQVFIGFFTVFALFFVYRGGEALANVLGRVMEERLDPRAPRYAALAVRAIRATVGGMAVLALFDGVATGLLYAAAGVPRPAVWGAVTGILAMLPFVGYFVVAGVGVGLAAHGAEWAALAAGLSGAAVIFIGDKVVRPLLVGSAVKLNLFWVLVGSLGGFQVLGPIGVFVGPVVLALCGEMWREWIEDR
jgi:predicted PurR-regulated permease PerM/GNAT superfamily N-acetyltransferase